MASQTAAETRRGQLLELIRQRGFAALPDLVDALAVSESTVRRDLGLLEQSGAARRTHGGAFYTGPSPQLQHFAHRQSAQWDEKRQIARAAARLIGARETVLLDGGSTTYELARLLADRPLHVVTNSLPVANLFVGNEGADLVMIGGNLHSRTGVCLGPHADAMVRSLNVRRAVLSVASVSEQGFYNNNLLLVETERAIMEVADEVIILVDSSKFGYTSLARLCGFADVGTVVVDSGLGLTWRRRLEEAGVRLVLAGVEVRPERQA